MTIENRMLLSILISLNLIMLQDCDCKMWFKKLAVPDDGMIRSFIYDKPPVIVWSEAGAVHDSIGPYGDIFISLVISDRDKIICSKILKGDSALLPKVEKYLSNQIVKSAENYGRKVYSLYPVRIQFIENSMEKRKRRKNGYRRN